MKGFKLQIHPLFFFGHFIELKLIISHKIDYL